MEERLWTKKYLFSLLLVFGVNMGYALLNSVMAIYGSVLTYSSVVGGYMITVFTLSALFIRLFIKKLNEKSTSYVLPVFSSILLTSIESSKTLSSTIMNELSRIHRRFSTMIT